MCALRKPGLINESEVLREIERFKWIESEKYGFDIGFERAAEEWLKGHAAPETKLVCKMKKIRGD